MCQRARRDPDARLLLALEEDVVKLSLVRLMDRRDVALSAAVVLVTPTILCMLDIAKRLHDYLMGHALPGDVALDLHAQMISHLVRIVWGIRVN
jgi:hypothetical protein